MRIVGVSLSLLTSAQLFAESEYALFSVAPNAKVVWSHQDLANQERTLLSSWALRRSSQGNIVLEIPTQTGRAALAQQVLGLPGEVLLKGSGYNPETALDVTKIRYDPTTKVPKTGDGYYGIREAWNDLINSSLLESASIPIPQVRAIIQLDEKHPKGGYRVAILAREFINQTRISNLAVMSPSQVRTELHRASQILFDRGITQKLLSSEELYFFLLERMARTTARLQEIGFEHAYLHWQQVTLAGELADNGTGTWLSDESFQPYTAHDRPRYFKFDRQPQLALNMFVRTHGLSQAEMVRLDPESETFLKQTNSLLGVFMQVDPAVAARIQANNPEALFWKTYRDELKQLDKKWPHSLQSRNLYSRSFYEHLQKHAYPGLTSETAERMRQRFSQLKQDWQVEALPDLFLLKEFGHTPSQGCSQLIKTFFRI